MVMVEDVVEDGLFKDRFTASVPMQEAERLRNILMENDLFDPEMSIGRDEMVHFPVKLPEGRDMEWFIWLVDDLADQVLISGPGDNTEHRQRRKTPFQEIKSALEGQLEPQEVMLLPDRWDMVGDCLVLKIDEGLLYSIDTVCGVYQEVLGARYTLVDMNGIQGELRKPEFLTVSEPENGDYDVVHIENGIRYRLDPRRIMFSSGNVDERTGIVEIIDRGPRPPGLEGDDDDEIVLDMFAGIGYFSIPIARECSVKSVHSIEKNPESYEYLLKNIEENGVTGKVIPHLGDNREVDPGISADRVIMGYIGGTLEFLDRAVQLISKKGAIIHLHDTVKVEDGYVWFASQAEKRLADMGYVTELLGHRKVKSYAPRIEHIVIDIRVVPRDM
ncbi:MAG: class I SAM-dependent methyltransferase family protein [Candidatus Thermoplasmatota archaeon]|nr:class I SAM-dependent methyltransferase family protein [Candidatus Thermoplasmatota archaeon]